MSASRQLWRAALGQRLRETVLPGPGRAGQAPRIGAEVELIPLDALTRRVVSVRDTLMPFLRKYGGENGWVQRPSSKGAPRFRLPGGGSLTLEPGGQIEYATPPFGTPGELLADLDAVVPSLVNAAADAGLQLLSAGMDPCNPIEDVPLQVESERYTTMDEYFATIGPAGARMMRQTASVQVNIDAAGDPLIAWRMLNAAAPYLTAIFANSRCYAGESTAFASYRAQAWRQLDPLRTGVFDGNGEAAEEYAAFALDAPVLSIRSANGTHLPLQSWLECGGAPPALVEDHFSTLFPEVRPRGYFEVRSIDAIPPEFYAAPILLLAGMVMDERATNECAELLGAPDPTLLERAGLDGLAETHLAAGAVRLTELATAAAERMGRLACPRALVDRASSFFDRYTLRGLAPEGGERTTQLA